MNTLTCYSFKKNYAVAADESCIMHISSKTDICSELAFIQLSLMKDLTIITSPSAKDFEEEAALFSQPPHRSSSRPLSWIKVCNLCE